MILLDQALGGYPAGTIILAGNSIPADLSKTQLDLYVSTDSGATWKFISHIANGGVAVSDSDPAKSWANGRNQITARHPCGNHSSWSTTTN